MSERDTLLRTVQELDFALYDAALYLDLNPCDGKAQAFYREQKALRERAAAQYTAKYGPLTQGDYNGGCWNWTCGPWPWQTAEEA